MAPSAVRIHRFVLLFCVALAGIAFVSAGPANLVAVDALGRTVGTVRSYNPATGTMQLEMQLNHEAVCFGIVNDIFTHSSRPLVFYESVDCTGAAYMMVAESMPVPGTPAAIADADQTLYRGNPQNIQNRTLKSALWTGSCKSVDIELDVMEATPVLDLGFEFLAPYRVVARGGRADRRRPPSQPDGNYAHLQDVDPW